MAFNIAIFKTRALTAFLFSLIMLAGILFSQWSFIILFIIIHFGCWYEFVKLIKKIYPERFSYFIPLGVLYITWPLLMMTDFSFFPFHIYNRKIFLPLIPCLVIFSIWVNDTMAYLVGSLIGKTPFSKISPKKTWEGTIGGIIASVLIIGFLGEVIIVNFINPLPALSYGNYFIIAGISSFFGTAGDLAESKLKRMAGVKDSGSFLPGHGGFLDRFDSVLFAIPFVWLYVYFFIS